jgi:hypothetical protein
MEMWMDENLVEIESSPNMNRELGIARSPKISTEYGYRSKLYQ